MNSVIELADAVTAAINSDVFTPSIEAERLHMPIFDLGAVGENIKVFVVPRGVTVTNASRDSNFFDISIDVGVQRRINPNDSDQIDAMLGLIEQIGDRLRLNRLATMPEAQWLTSEHEPIIAVEHLERLSVFTSVLTLTYRLTR